MSRGTVYNNFKTQEDLGRVNKENIELLDDFLDYLVSLDRTDKTLKEYKNNIEIFFVYLLKHRDNKLFTEINKKDIIKYQSYLLQKQLSPTRIQALKRALSSMSNYIENMLDREYPNFKNIINKIESPKKVPVREKTVISDEELEFILNNLLEKGDIQLACAVAMVASCGLRKAEILSLKADWFTEDKKINNGALWKTPKIRSKGNGRVGKQINKYFYVPICDKYVKLWLDYRYKNNIESEHMFLKSNLKENISENVLNYWAEKITEILNKPFYWHSLRHYITTHLAKNGVPLDAIQDYCGWSSIDMVSIYNDIEAEDKFEGLFTVDGIKKQENNLNI